METITSKAAGNIGQVGLLQGAARLLQGAVFQFSWRTLGWRAQQQCWYQARHRGGSFLYCTNNRHRGSSQGRHCLSSFGGYLGTEPKKLDFVDFLLHFFKSMFHFLLVKMLFYTLKNIPRDGERLRVPVALTEDLDSQSSITEVPGNLSPSSGLRRHLACM